MLEVSGDAIGAVMAEEGSLLSMPQIPLHEHLRISKGASRLRSAKLEIICRSYLKFCRR